MVKNSLLLCLLFVVVFSRFPPTAQEVARDEAQFRAGLKKMTERERSKAKASSPYVEWRCNTA